MPKLRQPPSLEKMAFDGLLEHVVDRCDQLSAEDSLDELRLSISVIKENVCNYLPRMFLADFCSRFLGKFFHQTRPPSHHEAALEILMDRKIPGLRCEGKILRFLDPSNAHRLRGLETLEMRYYRATKVPNNLENFHLNDLTTFIFRERCTNIHLEIIGRNCPKLEVVKVSHSPGVTDEGLRFLSSCSELRVVDVVECFRVSHIGLTYLLSAQNKLEDFYYGHNPKYERHSIFDRIDIDPNVHVDVLPGLDWSVQCPSIRRFIFENNRNARPVVGLQAIVKKFPNLVYLQINCMNPENFVPLKSLKKLTGLEVNFSGRLRHEEAEPMWESIKELLLFIGANITSLKLCDWDGNFGWHQDDMDFIFESCPNIEYLALPQAGGFLIIPPFRKLKELVHAETHYFHSYETHLSAMELAMLDHVAFPNLSVIDTNCLELDDDLEIECTAKTNNLDVEVKYIIEREYYDSFDEDSDTG